MKYQMPEPAAYRFNFDGYGWDYRDNGSGSSWKDMAAPVHGEFLHTEATVQAAFNAGRVAGLEEAAEEAATLFAHNGSAKSVDAISACICLIRNLAKETPCLDGTTDSAKTTTVSLDAGLQADLAQGKNLGDKT